jgi:hypothetical protein
MCLDETLKQGLLQAACEKCIVLVTRPTPRVTSTWSVELALVAAKCTIAQM